MTLDLYLVRHGSSRPNAENRYPGADEDAPLSLAGEGQARGLKLPPSALALASPSLRAVQTARLAGFEPIQTPDLREARFGVMAGRTWAELESEFADAPRAWIEGLADPNADVGPPEGESGQAFHARVQRWLSALPESGKVVAFTHLGPALAALRLTVGLHAAELPPGSVVRLRRSERSWWLVSLTPGQTSSP